MRTAWLMSMAVGLFASGTATAASLLVRPTTVELTGRTSAATLTLSNSGDEPITAQIRVFGWDQNANEDSLTPTTAVVASPPMTVIPPGESQVVRLVRVTRGRATAEEHYRLLVDEIADRSSASAAGVSLQLRYSVPVFVRPNTRDVAALTLTAEVASDSLQIDASNGGKAHAQISNISLAYADGSSIVVGAGLVGYVLPSKSRQWSLLLPPEALGQRTPQTVRAFVNGEELLLRL